MLICLKPMTIQYLHPTLLSCTNQTYIWSQICIDDLFICQTWTTLFSSITPVIAQPPHIQEISFTGECIGLYERRAIERLIRQGRTVISRQSSCPLGCLMGREGMRREGGGGNGTSVVCRRMGHLGITSHMCRKT